MSLKSTLKVGIVQHSCTADIEANFTQVETCVQQAAKQGAELIVLPELHDYPYFCQTEDVSYFDNADTIPGERSQSYADMAAENDVVLVTSQFEKRAPGIYHNTAVVFEKDGSMAGQYRKMHIPDDPGFYEKFYFTPGDLGFEPIETSVGKLGILVCWDQWFPEAARLMALAGADMLIYPTAIGWDPRDDEQEKQHQLDAWVTIQRSHAVANGIPIIVSNRSGHEEDPTEQTAGIEFWGNSFACGPQGEILKQTRTQPAIYSVEVDLSRSENVRRIWPFLRDRRIDAYYDLLRRYND